MEITNTLVAVMIAVGLVGVVVPVLPGLLLVWVAIVVWATERQDTLAWVVAGVVTVLLVAGSVAKYALPGRSMTQAGVPRRSTLTGAALGLVGFFVIPVLGLPIGFVLGVYLAERARLGVHQDAWASTVQALRAAGASMAIELATGLLMAATWGLALLI